MRGPWLTDKGLGERATLQERFEGFFRRGKPDECWLWKGGLHKKGAKFDVMRGSVRGSVSAPKKAYEFYVGPVLKGQCVHHICAQIYCVNPSHLKLISKREQARMFRAAGTKSRTILTPQQVKEIRAYRAAHPEYRWGCALLAKKYGVHPPTICDIAKYKRWKNI